MPNLFFDLFEAFELILRVWRQGVLGSHFERRGEAPHAVLEGVLITAQFFDFGGELGIDLIFKLDRLPAGIPLQFFFDLR